MSTPQPSAGSDPGWERVVRRRRRARGNKAFGDLPPRAGSRPATAPVFANAYPPRVKRRPPRTAAVTITGLGENFSYATVLKKARESIPLSELGIEKSRIRRTINGGRIIEISGLNAMKKADDLAVRLREVLGPEVIVNRPCVRGEIRVIGLDDTVSSDKVAALISEWEVAPSRM